MMIEQLQSSQDLQGTTTDEGDDLAGTEKTMPVDEPDDVAVAFRELYRGNFGSAVEAGKAYFLHSATMTEIQTMRETAELTISGKYQAPMMEKYLQPTDNLLLTAAHE